MSLRNAVLRIASELPKGDPTRRHLLAALAEGYKGQAVIEKVLTKALSKYRPKRVETYPSGDELIIKLWGTAGLEKATVFLNDPSNDAYYEEVEAVQALLKRMFPGTRVEGYDSTVDWHSFSVKPLDKAVEAFACPCCGRPW